MTPSHMPRPAPLPASHAAQAGRERAYCGSHYLSPATMAMIDGMRSQLLGELTSRGFAASLEGASPQAHRPDLVRAVLVSGQAGGRANGLG